ncbi:MAG TPA: helix-turn-helix domain-containing protein [Solirubrobacterales bacterium]
MAKALAHPLRMHILVETNKRAMSATQFANHFGGDDVTPTKANRHFRYLEKLGCLELVEERTGGRRRGGKEKIYKAVARSMFDESTWPLLPDSVQGEVTQVIFSSYLERVVEAVAAGTIDAREDRHFTWTGMHYDQQAWNELIERMDDLFRFSLELRVQAALRMIQSGEEPIPITVKLGCFESPKDADVAPFELPQG